MFRTNNLSILCPVCSKIVLFGVCLSVPFIYVGYNLISIRTSKIRKYANLPKYKRFELFSCFAMKHKFYEPLFGDQIFLFGSLRSWRFCGSLSGGAAKTALKPQEEWEGKIEKPPAGIQ